MGLKQMEEALEFLENCRHCLALPKKLWQCRDKVAPTQSMDFEQSDLDKDMSFTSMRMLRVHSSSFQILSESKSILFLCGGGLSPAEDSGTQNHIKTIG